jgi:hypothetical protein
MTSNQPCASTAPWADEPRWIVMTYCPRLNHRSAPAARLGSHDLLEKGARDTL